jgi:hypothetical protein
VVDAPDVNTISILMLVGMQFTWSSHGKGSAGARLYLDQSTAGDCTSTRPTSGWVQPVAKVKDSNTVTFSLGLLAEDI